MKLFPLHSADFYKTGHLAMYPAGTMFVYSNFTPRSDRLAEMLPDFDHKAVFFGLQGVIQWMLIDLWNDAFFDQPKAYVIGKFKRRMDGALGEGAVSTKQIEDLHDLGYLPLRIKALPEGSRVDMRVPFFTIVNTIGKFYWLTNYVESQISAECWKNITNATIAYEYRRLLNKYAERTGSPKEFVPWQGHDFSMRGMSGIYDAAKSGASHLTSFLGTDSISSIDYVEDYYFAKDTFVGGSVPATEHSVMCMGGADNELETFRSLLEDKYPSGVISIVADSWDFWKVVTEYATKLKPAIMARTPNAIGLSKVVFRPDSGDPVKVICGDPLEDPSSPAGKGAVQCLWEIFGGTETSTGHKLLDSHVGLIYGDSITLERAAAILDQLERNGFASANIVFGIGSYTYQHSTRDTLGHAYKCTWGVVNGEARELFKDPVTDKGTKKSAKGLLRVEKHGDNFVLLDQQTEHEETLGELKLVFENGMPYGIQSLDRIRSTLHPQ